MYGTISFLPLFWCSILILPLFFRFSFLPLLFFWNESTVCPYSILVNGVKCGCKKTNIPLDIFRYFWHNQNKNLLMPYYSTNLIVQILWKFTKIWVKIESSVQKYWKISKSILVFFTSHLTPFAIINGICENGGFVSKI